MADLDKLLSLPGALAVFEFTDRGELSSCQTTDGADLDKSVLDLLSHVCVANLSIATMQARGWEQVTGMTGFYPVAGFTMIGMDWSTVMHGTTGIVFENDKADFEAAYAAFEA